MTIPTLIRRHVASVFATAFVLALFATVSSGCFSQPPADEASTLAAPPATQYPASAPTKLPTVPSSTSPSPVTLHGPVTVAIASSVPEEYASQLVTKLSQIEEVSSANGEYPIILLDQAENADTKVQFTRSSEAEYALAQRFYAVVVPFDTVQDSIVLEELQVLWQGSDQGRVLVSGFNPDELVSVLGHGDVRAVNREDLLAELNADRSAIGIVPFQLLDPTLKTLTIDAVNVLDNHLDADKYPLSLALEISGSGAQLLYDDLAGVIEPLTNREADKLTTLIMTGVTAISRGTAAAIERTSLDYPALIISDTLSAADITHVSNEVPFLEHCVVNNTLNNLTLCSRVDYSATLTAIGTDIVGLSGNHVNDFGREGALESLTFYKEHNIPIYGSGFNEAEACEPLLWEHNGNTFAFIAALAYGPESAWATADEPGACYYYYNQELILTMVEKLSQAVDIVAVELQFEEAYDVHPLPGQVEQFRELRDAGADIVTGVQSHVPQAMEPYGMQDEGGPGVIVYGLGNLFFDQMWSWPVRTGLIARHTIYDGRLLSTEVLTTVLEDFAQPRWTTEAERTEILNSIFAAAPARPASVAVSQ